MKQETQQQPLGAQVVAAIKAREASEQPRLLREAADILDAGFKARCEARREAAAEAATPAREAIKAACAGEAAALDAAQQVRREASAALREAAEARCAGELAQVAQVRRALGFDNLNDALNAVGLPALPLAIKVSTTKTKTKTSLRARLGAVMSA